MAAHRCYWVNCPARPLQTARELYNHAISHVGKRSLELFGKHSFGNLKCRCAWNNCGHETLFRFVFDKHMIGHIDDLSFSCLRSGCYKYCGNKKSLANHQKRTGH
ncbi:hypothetical protein VTO58DRAFT_106196 [Aureobasidium pullulans]